VNVHPTKAEVRFREPGAVFAAIQRAVRKVLVANAPIPQVGAAGRAVISAWEQQAVPFSGLGTDGWNERRDALLHAGTGRHEDLGSQAQLDARHAPNEGHTWPPAGPPGSAGVPASTSTSVTSGLMPILRVVGQLGATYIVAEGPDGMYLIDQHAAHERVLFERFMAQRQTGIPSQSLLHPATVQLPPASARLIADQLSTLERLGFQVESFGPDTFLVRALPALLVGSDPAAALRVLVENFEEDETPLQAEQEARLIARVCKRAAVKAGKSLSPEEQRALLLDLEACESPRTCPHGRPTMIHLSVDLLERQFGRRGAR
jgi:DNA mismatch repair protein MutL